MEICSLLLFRYMAALANGGLQRTQIKRGTLFLLWRCTLVLLICFSHLTLLEGATWADRTESDESDENYYDSSSEDEADDAEDSELESHRGAISSSDDDDDSAEFEFEEFGKGQGAHKWANTVDFSDESDAVDSVHSGNAELIAQLQGLGKPGGSKRAKKFVPPVTITVPYPVHIERQVPVFIETKVPVYVEKKVEVPVDRPYEVPVPVKVPVYEKEVIHVPRPVVYNVDRPYPVYVHRTVFVNKYHPFKVLIKSRTRY